MANDFVVGVALGAIAGLAWPSWLFVRDRTLAAQMDLAAARRAIKEPGRNTSWESVKAELGTATADTPIQVTHLKSASRLIKP
jgi:hypothetical protein